MLYSITYKRPHNPHHSHFQNQVRGLATRIVKGEDSLKDTLEELNKYGHAIVSVYNNVGERVS